MSTTFGARSRVYPSDLKTRTAIVLFKVMQTYDCISMVKVQGYIVCCDEMKYV